MPISALVLITILICSAILLYYYRVQVIFDLKSEQSHQVLLVEIIPPLNRPRKQYRYTGYDLVDIIQKNLARQANPVLRIFAFFTRSKSKLNHFLTYPVYKKVSQFTVVENIEWKTRVGTNDAMYTAIVTGLIWSFKGIVISMTSRKNPIQKLIIDVQPDFSNDLVSSRLVCILKMRIVHIIIIYSYAFVLKVRRFINGDGARTTKSSN